jgi:DinB superfamily
MLEAPRIADQLRRAFSGDAWHGSPLSELLSDVAADQAFARPLASAHNIWELVLHIDAWVNAALQAAQGGVMPELVGTDGDWPPIRDNSPAAWAKTKADLFEAAEQLGKAVAAFSDARLQDTVPGRGYDFYHLFHGIVQHSLYHGGQIALLRKSHERSVSR